MQHITFAHWLPTIIGDEGMREIGPYQGYNASEVGTVSSPCKKGSSVVICFFS